MKLARRLAGFQGAWCTFGVLLGCLVLAQLRSLLIE